jgi:predicted nucleotidyltransferase
MKNHKDSELEEGEQAVLRSMFPKARELTIKEIMKNTPYSSYERNNSYLRSLARKKVIEEKKVGRTYVYSLIPGNWSSKNAFNSYALERAGLFSDNNRTISLALKEIPEEYAELVMLFGSYSRGTQRKDSDIDLLIVSSDKEKVDIAITSIRRRHGLELRPVIIPKAEFAKIKNENKELWNSLITSGVIFKGYELFYYYAYATQ